MDEPIPPEILQHLKKHTSLTSNSGTSNIIKTISKNATQVKSSQIPLKRVMSSEIIGNAKVAKQQINVVQKPICLQAKPEEIKKISQKIILKPAVLNYSPIGSSTSREQSEIFTKNTVNAKGAKSSQKPLNRVINKNILKSNLKPVNINPPISKPGVVNLTQTNSKNTVEHSPIVFDEHGSTSKPNENVNLPQKSSKNTVEHSPISFDEESPINKPTENVVNLTQTNSKNTNKHSQISFEDHVIQLLMENLKINKRNSKGM